VPHRSRTENYKRARQVRKGVVSGTHGDVIVFFFFFQGENRNKKTSKFLCLSLRAVPATGLRHMETDVYKIRTGFTEK
jgi:hypothetical protein